MFTVTISNKLLHFIYRHNIVSIIAGLFVISCTKTNENQASGTTNDLFTLLSNEITKVSFTNKVENKVDFNVFSYRNYYNGGGVAIGDINNDGLPDIYFTSNMGENKLYLNEGKLTFKDISTSAGIGDKDKWSTGVSMVDINNDGLLDIYVCNAGFRKGSDAKNSLYINQGNETFTEEAEKYGLADESYTTHAAFFDYDMDGDLDVYILNNSFIPVNTLNFSNARELRAKDWPVKEFLKGGGDKLMRNDNGKFTDISETAGIYGSLIGFGLGVTIGDVNGDHWPDIYVSNDFFERDYLYINDRNGHFKEDLVNRIGHLSTSSMGADMADLNNDGCPEIFVTDMLPQDEFRLKTTSSFDNINVHNLKLKNGFYNQFLQNSLQINDCNGNFVETAFYSGVAASDWSWGALLFDADQDMLTDIFICNGIYHDVIDQDFIDFFANDIIQKMTMTGEKEKLDSVLNRMPSNPIQNIAFRNTGDLKFEKISEKWGFKNKTFSNGAAYGDLDNDGDLDLVINNVNQESMIYRNNSIEKNKVNFIGIQLKSEGPNSFAIGSECTVFVSGNKLSKQLIPNRGFQSSMDIRLNFGIGINTKVDSLIIVWPDRSQSIIVNPAINKYNFFEKSKLQSNSCSIKKESGPIFSEVSNEFLKHEEDDHIDFYFERNIPVMLSKEGPKIACGDVNKDGYSDLYFCGASGQAGMLYLGTKLGFKEKPQTIFMSFKDWEDTEALFFDADGDLDLDLFVGSGGNNGPQGNREFQDRLYFNDGRGNFEIRTESFPPNGFNTSKAFAFDYDADGDMDLFVASRSFPGEYGIDPRSYVYKNNGKGVFSDFLGGTDSVLKNIGMLTDVVWDDITGDNKPELILIGDWMSPRVFSYSKNNFYELKTNLINAKGWWQSLLCTDIDKDGDNDLILGNMGTNGYLQNNEFLPIKLFINDFDKNGMPEKILTRTVEKKDMPVVMKREMMDQLNILKKKNLKHNEYAYKSLQELLGQELKSATIKSVNITKSCIAFNNGNGNFTLTALPSEVQWSSINDILGEDINEDGFTDLIMVGNTDGFQPQYGILDGNRGLVLINDKKGGFDLLNRKEIGFNIRGVGRQIIKVVDKKNNFYIVARNDEKPFTFKRNN